MIFMAQVEHVLDIFEQPADDIISGRRTFDIVNINHCIQTGDIVKYQCITSGLRLTKLHDINHKTYLVSYVCFDARIASNYAVIGLTLLDNSN